MQLNLKLINISGKYLDLDLIDSLGAFWLETGIDRIASANQLDLHENNFQGNRASALACRRWSKAAGGEMGKVSTLCGGNFF